MKNSYFLYFIVLYAFSNPAKAYLDPGTGSLILQMIIAGILSTLFALKMYWYRIKSFFKNIFNRETVNKKEDNVSENED